jgi:hypothetical protein
MISRPAAGRLFFGDKVDIFKRPEIYTINPGIYFVIPSKRHREIRQG